MATANVGIRSGNVIVPYVSSTKRTKQVALTVTGTNWTSDYAVGMAYADSSGTWRLIFNIRGHTSSGATSLALTLESPTAVTFPGYVQAAAAQGEGTAPYTASGNTGISTGRITISASSSTTIWAVSGDVALASEPTWAAANMEGVVAADVYIAPQVPGVSAGLVPAQGLDGRTDGVAVPAGKVGEYKEVEATSTNNATSSWVDVTGLSIALTPGEWVIGYAVAAALSGSATYITNVGIITGTSTIVSKTVAAILLPTGATSGVWVSASRQTKVTVSTTTTYKVAIRSGNAGTTIDVYGNSNTGGLGDPDNNSVMWAHRIA